MQEKSLVFVALVLSLAGLLLIFVFSGNVGEAADIADIEIEDVGSAMKICGNITSARVSKNHIFLDIRDGTGTIKFVIFNTTALMLKERGISPYELGAGQSICAPGIVEEYPKGSGTLEMVYRAGTIEII